MLVSLWLTIFIIIVILEGLYLLAILLNGRSVTQCLSDQPLVSSTARAECAMQEFFLQYDLTVPVWSTFLAGACAIAPEQIVSLLSPRKSHKDVASLVRLGSTVFASVPIAWAFAVTQCNSLSLLFGINFAWGVSCALQGGLLLIHSKLRFYSVFCILIGTMVASRNAVHFNNEETHDLSTSLEDVSASLQNVANTATNVQSVVVDSGALRAVTELTEGTTPDTVNTAIQTGRQLASVASGLVSQGMLATDMAMDPGIGRTTGTVAGTATVAVDTGTEAIAGAVSFGTGGLTTVDAGSAALPRAAEAAGASLLAVDTAASSLPRTAGAAASSLVGVDIATDPELAVRAGVGTGAAGVASERVHEAGSMATTDAVQAGTLMSDIATNTELQSKVVMVASAPPLAVDTLLNSQHTSITTGNNVLAATDKLADSQLEKRTKIPLALGLATSNAMNTASSKSWKEDQMEELIDRVADKGRKYANDAKTSLKNEFAVQYAASGADAADLGINLAHMLSSGHDDDGQ